jgi:hypothetical protein
LRPVKIIRIDPIRRAIAAMVLRPANEATPQLRRLIGRKGMDTRQILTVDEKPLMVICALNVDEAVPMWKFPGTDDNAGASILTGRDVESGRLIDVPVTTAWVRDRIQWLDGEAPGQRDERARDIIPALDDDLRAVLKAANVLPGGIWISDSDREQFGEALIALTLGTERSGGQMLTGLGEAVFDMLPEATDGE